uniref:Uncharacterized protein n=1 Tax=Populus trichocarpa TaxID=3694 RepID=A0A3N7GZL3_POPTR
MEFMFMFSLYIYASHCVEVQLGFIKIDPEHSQRGEDYEELAISVTSMVDLLVHKTSERIESATDILKAILKPIVDGEEEIHWLPRDPEALKLTERRYDSKGARRATRRRAPFRS